MKLSKAIEIGKDLLTELPQFSPDDRREAVKLGIEAMKRIKECQEHHCTLSYIELPGETEE